MRYVVYYRTPSVRSRWAIVARFRWYADANEYVAMLQSRPSSRLGYQIRNLDA